MKAIVTVGISASGKSSWAEDFCRPSNAWYNSNRDDIRFNHIIKERNWSKYKFNKVNEGRVTEIQEAGWKFAADNKRDLVVSDTNLHKGRRESLIVKLQALGYTVEVKDFPVTLEEAWKRDALRANGVGQAVIYKQWKQWLEYTGRKKYVPNTALPKAVMFDIDGTLAHMSDRGPFDWDKVVEDSVDRHLLRILRAYSSDDYKILIMSGRDSCCKNETKQWLYQNQVFRTNLIMRDAGDMRKDSIVKEELFWTNVAPYYNVEAVFDDRPQVIRMWYDIGIPKVIAVADQNIEF